MTRAAVVACILLLMVSTLLSGCSGQSIPEVSSPGGLSVGVVLGVCSENDKAFNEYTLKGAREAAQATGLAFEYITTDSTEDYERNVANMASKVDLVITPGYLFPEVTAKVARSNPKVWFVIVDVPYLPG